MAAKFSFAPDCNPEILKACNANNLFFIPGISTAKEMQLAYDYGYRLFKFFPAESSGGILKLEALYNDFKDQNIGFIPSGGINAANMNAYLNKPFVTGVAGSWIAPKALIKAKDWKAIAKNAKQALKNAAH
jgi:2-dehydro-3-deoxyphosphogluconate aldolase/(4S)-4-hydroxy-2-oxoglutarate aldolase